MALSPKKKRVTLNILLLAAAFVACRLIRQVNPGDPPDFSDARSAYRPAGGRWTAIPQLPGGTEGIEISRNGTVWATTPSRQGVNRWDGARWVHYQGSDFGTVRDTLRGGFALQGDEVWAAPQGKG